MSSTSEDNDLFWGCAVFLGLVALIAFVFVSCTPFSADQGSSAARIADYKQANAKLEKTVKQQAKQIESLIKDNNKLAVENAKLNADQEAGRSNEEREKAIELRNQNSEDLLALAQKTYDSVEEKRDDILDSSIDIGKKLGKAELFDIRNGFLEAENRSLRNWRAASVTLNILLLGTWLLRGMMRSISNSQVEGMTPDSPRIIDVDSRSTDVNLSGKKEKKKKALPSKKED